MKLEGKDKIKKNLTQKASPIFIVESYYGYEENCRMSLGEFYEDEIREYYQNLNIPLVMEKRDYGLVIFLPSREFKMDLLKKTVLNLTRPHINNNEMKLYLKMVAAGEVSSHLMSKK